MIPEAVEKIFSEAYGSAVAGVAEEKPWNGYDVYRVSFKKPMTVGFCLFALGRDGGFRLATPEEGKALLAR